MKLALLPPYEAIPSNVEIYIKRNMLHSHSEALVIIIIVRTAADNHLVWLNDETDERQEHVLLKLNQVS